MHRPTPILLLHLVLLRHRRPPRAAPPPPPPASLPLLEQAEATKLRQQEERGLRSAAEKLRHETKARPPDSLSLAPSLT